MKGLSGFKLNNHIWDSGKPKEWTVYHMNTSDGCWHVSVNVNRISAIPKNAYLPRTITQMKQDIIVLLYKCGWKRNVEPSSYRATTQTYVILKIFKHTLLKGWTNNARRCKYTISRILTKHWLYFDTLECILYTIKTVNVSLIDSKQTFDSTDFLCFMCS